MLCIVLVKILIIIMNFVVPSILQIHLHIHLVSYPRPYFSRIGSGNIAYVILYTPTHTPGLVPHTLLLRNSVW